MKCAMSLGKHTNVQTGCFYDRLPIFKLNAHKHSTSLLGCINTCRIRRINSVSACKSDVLDSGNGKMATIKSIVELLNYSY